MSEERPNGWYRDEPGQQARPGFTPRPDAEGSPYEPTQAGLTKTEEDQLALGHDISGGRSDTIMLLHMPSNGTRPTLVSIPRDSYVPIPGHGYNKINAAYSLGGPKLLIQTVQNVTGLRIDHYMGIGPWCRSAGSATRARVRWWNGTPRRPRRSSMTWPSTRRCRRTSSPAPPSPGPHSARGEPPGMRPGQHGYEFKTKAPVSVCVYICRHLHGMTPYNRVR